MGKIYQSPKEGERVHRLSILFFRIVAACLGCVLSGGLPYTSTFVTTFLIFFFFVNMLFWVCLRGLLLMVLHGLHGNRGIVSKGSLVGWDGGTHIISSVWLYIFRRSPVLDFKISAIILRVTAAETLIGRFCIETIYSPSYIVRVSEFGVGLL